VFLAPRSKALVKVEEIVQFPKGAKMGIVKLNTPPGDVRATIRRGTVVSAPLGSRNVMLRLPVVTRVLVAASTPTVSPSCQKAVGETGLERDAGMTVLKVAGAFSLVALTVTVPFTLLFVMFRETNEVG